MAFEHQHSFWQVCNPLPHYLLYPSVTWEDFLASGAYRADTSFGLSLVHPGFFSVAIITCRTPSRNTLPCVSRGFDLQLMGWWLLPAVEQFPFEPCHGTSATISQCCLSCKKTTSRRSCCTLLCGDGSPGQTLLPNPWSLSKPHRSQAVPWYEPQPVPKQAVAARGRRDPVTQIKLGDLWGFIQL